MPDFDPSELTLEERGRIAKRARRNVGSEITLILTAGFSLVAVTLFFLGKFTFLPLAELMQLRPTVVWIGLSFLISLIGGLVHGWVASSSIARARERQFLVHQFDGSKKRAETEKKIKALK
ncbi:hypothetical protein [uncultured Ruegeria sp.]|uniref:hypothetical protein n=1 Tax=uncultured Ruegeria sp. TaxID=259304 RepID=UPI00262D2C9E|nr:hypothetical protein [uncultured Ruegeria sp.]